MSNWEGLNPPYSTIGVTTGEQVHVAELVHLPAGQAALFDDPAKLRTVSDAEFRVWCSDVLSAAKKYLAPLGRVVGVMLAEANQRWTKDEYLAFADECAETIGVTRSTLWRWRAAAEKAHGLPPEHPRRIARSRSERPPIEANSESPISPLAFPASTAAEDPNAAEPPDAPPQPGAREGSAAPSPGLALNLRGEGEPAPSSPDGAASRHTGSSIPPEGSPAGPSPVPRSHGAQGEPGDGVVGSLHETKARNGTLDVPTTVASLNAWLLVAPRVDKALWAKADPVAFTTARRVLNKVQEEADHAIRERPLQRREVTPAWKRSVEMKGGRG